MRNLFKSFILVATALLLGSCANEPTEIVNGVNGTVLTVNSAATRTSIDDKAVLWSAGDQIAVVASDDTVHAFTLTEVAGTSVGKFACADVITPTFAVYPYSAGSSVEATDGMIMGITAAATQNAGESLKGVLFGKVNGASVAFRHISSYLKFSVDGADAISSIVVVANTATDHISGNVDFEFNDTTISNLTVAGTNSVTLAAANGTIPTGTYYLPLVAKTLVGGYTITVNGTETITKHYSKDFLFEAGKEYPVTYKSAPAGQAFVKVTEEQTDWSGDYLIVYETGTDNIADVFDGVDSPSDFVTATIVGGNSIAYDATLAENIVTIAPMTGGYSILIKNGLNGTNAGKYIGQATNTNGLTFYQDAQVNTISLDTDNIAIAGAAGAHLRYNATSGQDRFRYYKSTSYSNQQPIQLYKLQSGTVTPPTPTPTITCANIENVPAAGVTDATTTITLKDLDGVAVSAVPDGTIVTSAAVSGTTLTYSVAENTDTNPRQGSIVLSATGAENVTVTVSQLGKAAAPSGTHVFYAEFDNTSATDSTQALTVETLNAITQDGYIFSAATKAFKGKHGDIKLGSSSAVGSVTTMALDLSQAFTMSIDVAKYGTDTGDIHITAGSQEWTIAHTDFVADVQTTFTHAFNAEAANTTITIATTAKRGYIDNIVVDYGSDAPAVTPTPTIVCADINGIAAAGVTDATTTITLKDLDGVAVSAVPDGTIVTSAAVSGTTLTYSVAENTGAARRYNYPLCYRCYRCSCKG